MKMKVLMVAVLIAVAAVAAQVAQAWHASEVKVSAKCNVQTGTYEVTAEITQSGQWPGAFVKSITPVSFAGSTSGSQKVVVVIGWPSTSETQTWTKYVTLDGTCAKVCEPVVIVKEVPGPERIVYVDRPVEKRVEVPGPERIVEKIKTVPAKVKPCLAPSGLKGATVRRGKDGNCYITVTKVKVVKSKPIRIKEECVPPKPPRCEGDCSPKKLHEGGKG